MNEYIIAHPPNFCTQKFQGFFHFPGGQLAQRWRGHFWPVGEKTERRFLLEKMQLNLETIHDTLKKLDLLFKLQVTIELFQFLNNYYHSCFFSTWIGWNLEWIHSIWISPDSNIDAQSIEWITFISKASPHRQLEGHRLMEINFTPPHNHP